MDRIALTKKQRFNVFKRDFFACQYCGATPPGAVLEVDHIHPVSQGGKNSIDNLLTACFDCNRGKGAGLLTVLPQTISEKTALIAEKLEQLKAFNRLVKQQIKIEEAQIDEVEAAFNVHYDGVRFGPKFRASVRKFIQEIPVHIVCSFVDKAFSKCFNDPYAASKYFCGICWKTIKGEGR